MTPENQIPSDQTLLDWLFLNQERALGVLMDKYYASLCAFAAGLLGNGDEAEDVVISIFQNLWERRQTLDIHTNLKAYLFMAVRNNSLKAIRKNSSGATSLELLSIEVVEAAANALEAMEIQDREQEIQSLLEQLPQRRKKIFILNKYEDLSHTEIANRLKISEKTVINQLRMATKQLRELIGLFFFL